MSPKSLALIGAAALVFGAAVYLFIQVNATSAQAHVPAEPRSSDVSPAAEQHQPVAARPAETVQARDPEPRSPKAEVRSPTVTAPPAPSIPSDDDDNGERANPRFDSMMELANKAYDRQDFDEAIAIAGKVLTKDPTNVRMLRVMVSANCIGGDAAVAQQYYERLEPKSIDREQMKTRCDRYQVTLKD